MKKVVKISLALSGVVLVGSLVAGYWFYYPVHSVQNTVRDSLTDPDSAKFSKVTFDRQTGYGCGLVNSKNKVGGYVGNKTFVAAINGEVTLDPEVVSPELAPEKPKPAITTISLNPFDHSNAIATINAQVERGRELESHSAAVKEAARINEAFKALVKAKCPSF